MQNLIHPVSGCQQDLKQSIDEFEQTGGKAEFFNSVGVKDIELEIKRITDQIKKSQQDVKKNQLKLKKFYEKNKRKIKKKQLDLFD